MNITELSIDMIGLSVRSRNALKRIDVCTVGDMLPLKEESLLQVRNLGQKSVQEILQKIEEYKSKMESGENRQEEASRVAAAAPIDFEAWLSEKENQAYVSAWLQERNAKIEELELLSTRAFNLLLFNGYDHVHQIAFVPVEKLLEIPRMDVQTAEEIVRMCMRCIREQKDAILAAAEKTKKAVSIFDMLYMQEYWDRILRYVQTNDVTVASLNLSNRSRNQLLRNGYAKLSDILFLSRQQLLEIPGMGAASAEQIQERIGDYLTKQAAKLISFCNGDESVLWDDEAIRKKILGLYQKSPFGGFSLGEMLETLGLPEQISPERIKRITGRLLAEKELEYVDFRCYRMYGKFEETLLICTDIDERSRDFLQKRLHGSTLAMIAQEYGIERERVRQVVKRDVEKVRLWYAGQTGKGWFDEDYYRYLYETYELDKRDSAKWLGISKTVWNYLNLINAKPGSKNLQAALEDQQGLDVGIRLKIKNYLNRNKIFVDGMWVEKKRADLEKIAVRKFCRENTSFQDFVQIYNGFLEDEEIAYDEEIYCTEAVCGTRKNHLMDARYLLWKQNEQIRYYDIDGRDFTELLDTLNLNAYENIELSTLKFMKEYPDVMEKYDIRDQYELHNLLRKIIPDGSLHDFHCGRTPQICFGNFDRDNAILELLIDNAPISAVDLCSLVHEEYGYDSGVVMANYLKPFAAYYHQGIYSIDQKVMSAEKRKALQAVLTGDFYYIDEIRKQYAKLFPNADLGEINPYNLKNMGFIVLSRYVVQHYPSLEAYCEDILTREDIVDIRPYRRRFAYVQMFSQKLMELKRNLIVTEFEPNMLINFRKLARSGITRKTVQQYCDQVYDFVEDGAYFSIQSLKQDGFESELFGWGFSDWFYANLLLSDDRFSFTNTFGTLILYKGKANITIKSFLINRITEYGWVDSYDLMTELTEKYGCRIDEKADMIYKVQNTEVFHDKILDRLYVNEEAYYRDLDRTGGF